MSVMLKVTGGLILAMWGDSNRTFSYAVIDPKPPRTRVLASTTMTADADRYVWPTVSIEVAIC